MEKKLARQQEIIKPFKARLRKPSTNALVVNGEINKAALQDALNLAFPDITPRTMHRDPGWETQPNCKEFKDMPMALFDHIYKGVSFGDRLKGWFEQSLPADPQGDAWKTLFDAFHATACDTVVDFLQKQLYTPDSVAYGKAQKVVNMTFKHIYCLDGAHTKEEWFYPCHIALDSFTLEWFCRTVPNVVKGCVDSWSALKNTADTIPDLPESYAGMSLYAKIVEKDGKKPEIHKFYTYSQIVKLIRNYFAGEHPFKGLCPLQAEFYIWPQMQLHLAAEALYNQDSGMEIAVAEAEKDWHFVWTDTEKEDISKQFDRCKKHFKSIPLEDKLAFLEKRVNQIRNCVHIYIPK